MKVSGLAAVGLAAGMAMAAAQAPDPYGWLEEIDGAQALEWARARNAETMSALGRDARFQQLKSEALAVLTAKDRIPYPVVRGRLVYNFWQDDVHVKGLWRRTPLKSYRTSDPKWETLIDFDALGKAEKKSWVFKGADCLEPKAERCMVALSDGGGDTVAIREFDVPSKSFVKEGFVLAPAKQSTTWLDEDTLLVATPLSEDEKTSSGYARLVRLWHRGTEIEKAGIVFEADKSNVAASAVVLEHDDKKVPLLVRALTFFESEYAVMDEDNTLHALPVPRDCEVLGYFKGELILRLRTDWKTGKKTFPGGAYVSFALEEVMESKAVPVPEPRIRLLFAPSPSQSAEHLAVAKDAVYVHYLDNVGGRLSAYRFSGGDWTGKPVPLGEKGAIGLAFASPYETRVFATYEDFLTPDSLLSWEERGDKPEVWKTLPARFSAPGYEVAQLWAASSDGTRIPYFLVRRADAKGPMPTLLYAYGGFEVSQTPFYSPTIGKLWLEKGGQFALANIRGGGEFGPRWHQAALKERRQLAFDDFAAVARDLVWRGATSTAKLGIMGGSNGGLLMGVQMTQHPELYKAVVIQVPLLDMLRYTHLGAGASWIGEYGDPDIPAERAHIEKYSPLHALKPGAKYPVPFVYTSTRDDRVHPGHARKFAARMMEQGHEVHYFERIEGGHAAGADLLQTAEEKALEYAYLARMLFSGDQ